MRLFVYLPIDRNGQQICTPYRQRVLAGIIISIAKSFSGDKGSDVALDQLLPFPISEEANQDMLYTKEALKKLITQRKVPIHVIAALNKVITT